MVGRAWSFTIGGLRVCCFAGAEGLRLSVCVERLGGGVQDSATAFGYCRILGCSAMQANLRGSGGKQVLGTGYV